MTVNSSSKNLRIAYLINNRVINYFKQIYQFPNLINILQNQGLLNGLSYQKCDENYEKINEFLNKNKDYIKGLQIIEMPKQIKFNEDDLVFKPKYLYNQQNLVYIDNFEIIDQEYHSFLLQKFGENLLMYPIESSLSGSIYGNGIYLKDSFSK